jgi:hypothetical protein
MQGDLKMTEWEIPCCWQVCGMIPPCGVVLIVNLLRAGRKKILRKK